MTILVNTFEGDVGNVGPGNSSGGGDAWTVVDINGIPEHITYDASRHMHGTQSGKWTIGASRYGYIGWNANSAKIAGRAYLFMADAPAREFQLIRASDGGGSRDFYVQVNGARKLQFDGKGTWGTWASSDPIPLGQWVRVEFRADKDAGSFELAYYLGDDATAATGGATMYSSGAPIGTGTFGPIRIGVVGTYQGSTPLTFWLDSAGLSTGADAAAPLGPYIPPAPPAPKVLGWTGMEWKPVKGLSGGQWRPLKGRTATGWVS